MPIINKYDWVAIVALLAIVVAGTAFFVGKSWSGTPGPVTTVIVSSSTTSATAAIALATTTNTVSKPVTPSPAPTPTTQSIHLVTPTANNVWTITRQNLISWDRAGGVTGQIELLDAATYKLVGVILNQIDARQTSYTWNTRDLLMSRTSPAKITVVPGSYVVRISFDGNHLSPITSPTVTIVAAAQ